MTIQDRAVKVLREIDEHLALAEKATPGPWTTGQMPRDVYGTDGLPVASTAYPHTTQPRKQRIGMSDASFIAASRTGWPTTLRCLKTAIEGLTIMSRLSLLRADVEESSRALTTLCDEWESK